MSAPENTIDILLLGSGGREHALAAKLAESRCVARSTSRRATAARSPRARTWLSMPRTPPLWRILHARPAAVWW